MGQISEKQRLTALQILERDRKILEMISKDHSPIEIAKQFGITRQRVSQIKKHAAVAVQSTPKAQRQLDPIEDIPRWVYWDAEYRLNNFPALRSVLNTKRLPSLEETFEELHSAYSSGGITITMKKKIDSRVSAFAQVAWKKAIRKSAYNGVTVPISLYRLPTLKEHISEIFPLIRATGDKFLAALFLELRAIQAAAEQLSNLEIRKADTRLMRRRRKKRDLRADPDFLLWLKQRDST